MNKVISASRRTDLVAFFPDWLAGVVSAGEASFSGPSGGIRRVSLRPEEVHTIVLWSKNFANLLENRFQLKELLGRYEQLYFLFTITGLGGTLVEKGVPPPSTALGQVRRLVRLAGHPLRVSVRFDPVVFWREGGRVRTNLDFFEQLAPVVSKHGIRDIRFSVAHWYRKAVRRSRAAHFDFVDPAAEEKLAAAIYLAERASAWNLKLHACSQDILTDVQGVLPSSCIDGALLQELHPVREPVSQRKDKSQRPECRCTESVDIGSYTQSCPHCCLYCYANPR